VSNIYLEILELQPGATKEEIKKSYRRLSKKYHPDVSKDDEATEKFIAINEAYKFLTTAGPKPHNEPVSYSYDPTGDEYEKWRQQARAYAWKKAREAERQQNELIKNLLRLFNTAAALIIVFNVALSIDFFLPRVEHDQDIVSVSTVFENRGTRSNSRKIYRYDDIIFEDFHMRFDKGEIKNIRNYTKASVVATRIFKKPMLAKITVDGEEEEYRQVYNVFIFFGFLIPAMFLILWSYRFFLKSLDSKLTMAIFMIIVFVIQLYVFFEF